VRRQCEKEGTHFEQLPRLQLQKIPKFLNSVWNEKKWNNSLSGGSNGVKLPKIRNVKIDHVSF